MTREEIRKAMRDTKKEVVLKNLHRLLSLVEGYPEYEDCVGYAIEALEQEPCDDAISRQAVCRLLVSSIGKSNTCIHTEVLKLPSVTPQDQVYTLCEDCRTKMDEVRRAYDNAMKQEPILDKIFCIVHPLNIMSTPELEHKAIMQIAEMLEPLCLAESEKKIEL